MPAQNVMAGDEYDFKPPQTQIEEEDLSREKNAARYSKTKEFKELKEHMESRIDFYQKNLPDGRVIGSTSPTPQDWMIANAVIAEFKMVINFYESSKEMVQKANEDNG